MLLAKTCVFMSCNRAGLVLYGDTNPDFTIKIPRTQQRRGLEATKLNSPDIGSQRKVFQRPTSKFTTMSFFAFFAALRLTRMCCEPQRNTRTQKRDGTTEIHHRGGGGKQRGSLTNKDATLWLRLRSNRVTVLHHNDHCPKLMVLSSNAE